MGKSKSSASIGGTVKKMRAKRPALRPLSIKGFSRDLLLATEQIQSAITKYLPLARREHSRAQKSLENKIAGALGQFRSATTRDDARLGEDLGRVMEDLKRLVTASHPELILRSLFLTSFTELDAFMGDLLRHLYRKRKDLLRAVDKKLSISDVEEVRTRRDVLELFIEKEVDSIRRESYEKQFTILEARFGVKLREFDNWQKFIECAQRRNLLTHCGGVVNAQYLAKCKAARVAQSDPGVSLGDRVSLTADYVNQSIAVIQEMGIKLTHVLWRKLFPDERESADRELCSLIYDLLANKRWRLAQNISRFAVGLPEHFNTLTRHMLVINYAQSIRWAGDLAEARKVLAATDWSSSSKDFRLAVEVIRGDYRAAAVTMRAIGTKGEMVEKGSYAVWPLFRAFRKSAQFKDAFEDLYAESFADYCLEWKVASVRESLPILAGLNSRAATSVSAAEKKAAKTKATKKKAAKKKATKKKATKKKATKKKAAK